MPPRSAPSTANQAAPWPSERLQAAYRELCRRLQACKGQLSEASIHEARTAARRLFSLLKFLKPWVKISERRDVMKALRWYLEASNASRDGDVRLLALGREDPDVFDQSIIAIARRERDREYDALRALLSGTDYKVWTVALQSHFDHILEDETVRAITRGEIEARFRQALVRLRREVGDAGHAGRFPHRLRIKVKRLRYVAEGLALAHGRDLRAALAGLKRLQRALGGARDAENLIRWLRRTTGMDRRAIRKLCPVNHANLARTERKCRKVAALPLQVDCAQPQRIADDGNRAQAHGRGRNDRAQQQAGHRV